MQLCQLCVIMQYHDFSARVFHPQRDNRTLHCPLHPLRPLGPLGPLSLCDRFWLLATLNTLNDPKPAIDSSQWNQRGNSTVEIPNTDATSGADATSGTNAQAQRLARHAFVGAARLPSGSVTISLSATTHGRVEAQDGNTSWQYVCFSHTESAARSYNKPVAHQRLKDGVDKTTNHGPLLWSLAQNRASSQKYPSTLDTDMRGPFQICSQPFKFLDKLYKQTSTDLDLIGVFKLHENKKQRGSRGATLHRQELHSLLNKHDKDSWEARDGELSCTCWALANA